MGDILRWEGAVDGNMALPGNYETAPGVASGSIPVITDELTFSGTPANSPSSNLDAIDGVLLNKLTIEQSYSGTLGSPTEYVIVSALVINIGGHTGARVPAGSGRIKLRIEQEATDLCTINVHNSSSSGADTPLPPVQLLSVHTGASTITTILNVYRGKVGVAVGDPAETSELVSVNVSYVANRDSDATVEIGPGVTITTVTKTGGHVDLSCAATTVENRGGTLTTRGSGAITTMTASAGTVKSNSSGTIANLNADGGLVDFTGSSAARTVTNTNRRAAGRIRYDSDVITFSNTIDTGGPVELLAA